MNKAFKEEKLASISLKINKYNNDTNLLDKSSLDTKKPFQ